MIRFFDLFFSISGLVVFSPLIVVLFFLGLLDTGSPIFSQTRIGKNEKTFTLYKFRSMKLKTPSISSHLLDKNSFTAMGSFLRRTKLDELPQLWNVLKGDMVSLAQDQGCQIKKNCGKKEENFAFLWLDQA